MDRALDSLSSACRAKVVEGLARLTERGVMVMIVQTSRTLAEAQANVANGTSATTHSKHLLRKLRGVGFPPTDPDINKADAIDLCPYDVYQLHGPAKLMWNASDPAFRAIIEVGEALDFRSGGRWQKPVDPGHWELVITDADRRLTDEERKRVLV